MKYSLSRPNIRWEMAEEWANELDNRSIEIILLEEQREKKILKKNLSNKNQTYMC